MSRMDRYYNNETRTSKRSLRNQELYKNIYDDSDSYSNIEGIATIEKSNEVDITKVKNMLKNREDYMKQKELRSFIPNEIEEPKYETFERDEDRVYDIRDILNRAKSNKEQEKYHNLDEKNLEMLRKLKEQPKEAKYKEEVGDMLNSIHTTSQLNKLTNQDLGLDMFEDLKSNSNTIIGDKSSIKAILDEAKSLEEKKKDHTNTSIDKSFFTSSIKFDDEDFDGFEKPKKKTNILVKLLLFVILIAVSALVVFIVFNLLK